MYKVKFYEGEIMKKLNTVFLLLIVSTTLTIGAVSVTPAPNGTNLVRSTSCANGTPGGYATLGALVITENIDTDFSVGGTLILNAPSNWQFNTSASITVDVTPPQAKIDVTLNTIASGSITFDVTVTATNKVETVTITGIEVQAIDGTIVAGIVNITPSGTATIAGLTSSTNMGSLSLDYGTPLPVETFNGLQQQKSITTDLRFSVRHRLINGMYLVLLKDMATATHQKNIIL